MNLMTISQKKKKNTAVNNEGKKKTKHQSENYKYFKTWPNCKYQKPESFNFIYIIIYITGSFCH